MVTRCVKTGGLMSLGTEPLEIPLASPLTCWAFKGSQGRFGGAPLLTRAALPGALDFLFFAYRVQWSFSHHRICDEASVYRESKQLQMFRRLHYPHALHARLSYWQWTEIRGFSRMEAQPDYSRWSTDELVERVINLERQLQSQKAK